MLMQVDDVPVNRHILRGLSELFNSQQDSDCVVIFCLGHSLDAETEPTTFVKHKGNGSRDSSFQAIFGNPLPAHRFVLRNASDHFKAKLELWSQENDSTPIIKRRRGCSATGKGSSASMLPSDPPQLFIPLAGADEVASARAAIQFAYTGQVAVASIREALEVRRQGAYLQIHGCAAACDELIMTRLKAAAASSKALKTVTVLPPPPHGSTRATFAGQHGGVKLNGTAHNNTVGPRSESSLQMALELCQSEALWPSQAKTDPSFQSVLVCAGTSLASHFGSTLETLNRPSLRRDLLSLPSVALEWLLRSDHFATDCESSVLLLLATWMEENFDDTDCEVRERLCRTIRLVQLSRPYASTILLALAADYEVDEDEPAGWFQMDVAEAAFISSVVNAHEGERELLMDLRGDKGDTGRDMLLTCNMTYSIVSRPQCIPPSSGSVIRWQISTAALLDAIHEAMVLVATTATVTTATTATTEGKEEQILDGGCVGVGGGGGNNCWTMVATEQQQQQQQQQQCSTLQCMFEGEEGAWLEHCYVAGIGYSVWVEVYGPPNHQQEQQQQQQLFAGLFVQCDLPSAFAVPGSRLCKESACRMVVRDNIELTVHRWREGIRRDIRCRSNAGLMDLKHCWGWSTALPLRSFPQQQQQQQTQQTQLHSQQYHHHNIYHHHHHHHHHRGNEASGVGVGSSIGNGGINGAVSSSGGAGAGVGGNSSSSSSSSTAFGVDSLLLLAPWSDYLRDGKISGTFTVRCPTS